MKDPELAKMLLEKAREDSTALIGMNDTSIFSNSVFGFHAQQSVEKLLKAWLNLARVKYPLITIIFYFIR